eukprot:TRINITY_DN13277_c0_g1_i2.p1 TRINITY_DN13277_c0_g1~~TRINITY_DN13277_c0_g1_i2.p1  ORF type:complete len:257 (+),score=49.23 TRINITY_DN13277_c0_g1_i2:216-986(+)
MWSNRCSWSVTVRQCITLLKRRQKKRVSDDAKESGVPVPDEMIRQARESVLQNAGFKDAGLSEAGKEQARAAGAKVRALTTAAFGLKRPEVMFVSPLQRTLQTAALMDCCGDVHVRELLRERVTGFPCDTRSRVDELRERQTFGCMNFDHLNEFHDLVHESLEHDALAHVEDKPKLRLRAAKVADLLLETEAESICLVTHKGFLRELERGPFGRPSASEFANSEVRVCWVAVSADGTMQADVAYAGQDQPAAETLR